MIFTENIRLVGMNGCMMIHIRGRWCTAVTLQPSTDPWTERADEFVHEYFFWIMVAQNNVNRKVITGLRKTWPE